jgi:hypothetical protein
MRRWFHRNILSRRWLAFAVMGIAFFCFGVGTLNLFMLLKANAELFAGYGWQAVLDGGLQQLVELMLTGYVSLICYLVFQSCEYTLVRHLSDPPAARPWPESSVE